jgi:hypothetical protein
MRLAMLVVAVLGLAGCAANAPTVSTAPLESYRPAGSYQLLVRVEGRSGVMLIESGPAGVVYTLKDRDRQVLVNRATLAEVKAQLPEEGRKLERTVVWAGM